MESGITKRGWAGRVTFWVAAAAVIVAVGMAVYDIGLIQGRYDIGAPDWVEGSFGWLIVLLGAVVSTIVLGLAALIGRGAAGGPRRALGGLLVAAVIGLWVGYGAGWLTAAVQGPTVERPGSITFALGQPIGATFKVAGTCVSVIGDGGLLAEVDPADATAPVVYLRHRVVRNPFPALIEPDQSQLFEVPGGDPPVIGPYDWSGRILEERPDGGRMVVAGMRWGDGTGPPSIEVEVSWACEPASGQAVSGESMAAPAPAPPAAVSFDTFAAGQCAALQSLFRAIGNPDTGSSSPLMQSFEEAIERGDGLSATAKAAEIVADLEVGRAHARAAGAWAPAGPSMANLDRVLAAMQAMVTRRLAAMGTGATAAEQEGQAAFEAAGGVEAWFGWIEGVGDVLATDAGGGRLPPCEGVPIS